MNRTQFLLALVAGAALAGSEYAAGAVIYQTIARTGQQAPGTGGANYSNFDIPSLNDIGQVTFSGHLGLSAGVNTTTDDVLYAGPFASPQLVARAGNPAPGMPAGVNYLLFRKVDLGPFFNGATLLNDAGQIAFLAQLTGSGVTTSNREVFYAGAVGTPQVVARAGDPAPGTPAGVVYGAFDPRLNESGQVAIYGSLGGPGVSVAAGNYAAAYVGTPGSMQLAARDGDPAPGTTVNYGGSGGSLGLVTFNDAGQIAFWDTLQGAGTDFTNRQAVFAGAAGSVQLVARNGNPAHDAPAGVNYGGLVAHSTTVNDAGQMAYWAFWTTGVGGVDSTNDEVLYAGPIGSPQLLVREGSAAPGTPAGVNYSTFSTSSQLRGPILNDAGQVAFMSRLTGVGVTTANDEALFAGPLASPQLIAREGDPAPGTPSGVNFSVLSAGNFVIGILPIPAFNDAGQIALQLQLTGSGVTAANDEALYLFDPTLGPVLIAREGNSFDIGGGVFRTIKDFGITFAGGHNDDMVTGLSDDGTLVFRLEFTDNTSGIFAATIPEPAALSLLALGATILHLRRRRTCYRATPVRMASLKTHQRVKCVNNPPM